jgi:hypothetical protein
VLLAGVVGLIVVGPGEAADAAAPSEKSIREDIGEGGESCNALARTVKKLKPQIKTEIYQTLA